jgi:imidazolonepropionase-like amidohydrolase
LGTLEIGKLADLIVVDGNPLDDLNVMDSVLYVVKDGEIVVSPQGESK